MPPAVHPGWIHWSIRGQTSSKPEGEGANMTPHDVNTCEESTPQIICLLTHSCWQPWCWTPGQMDMWACWQRTARKHLWVNNSRFLLPQRDSFSYTLTPVTAWEQFLISPVWLICKEEQKLVSFSIPTPHHLDTNPTVCNYWVNWAVHKRAHTESSIAYVLMKWASILQIHREKTSPRRRGIRPLEESVQDLN